MKYRNVYVGVFLERVNRFVARVEIDGREERVHVKNTGRCAELLVAGNTVYLEKSEAAGRKTAFDLVGRFCESGDIVQPAVSLPDPIRRGDIVAVCTTGAYNYSMASNYNRIPRPPVVMLTPEGSYIAVRRETLDDLTALDL